MPATMMHLYAGKQLLPQGSDSFFLGCILPDCVDAHREWKDHLHFRDVPPENRLENIVLFGKALQLNEDFDFGMLCHFYLDYLWDNGPQREHRLRHGEENWFCDYRRELSCAGSRVAQRMVWATPLWKRLENPCASDYEGTLSFPEDEIRAFLSFNARWHTQEVLPQSKEFTDDLVDDFIQGAVRDFLAFFRQYFPEDYEARKATLPPL